MRALLICFLFCLFSSPVAAQQTPAEFQNLIEGIQSGDGDYDHLSIQGLMDSLRVPGVSIAVIKDFKIHWAKAYGVADLETGAPVDIETLFQAASISKPVAAMAVMKAVQDGLFTLDDDINSILTSWELPASQFNAERPVTPRMLTSHTAGLGDGFGFPGYHPDNPVPTTVQILNGDEPSNVGPVFMDRLPMSEAKYSGGGVTMMEQALMDATGKSFAEYAQTMILDPLEMSRSTFAQPLTPAQDKNAARAHNRAGRSMNAKWHVYPELAAAGLWTTPTDLAKFAIEVQKSLVNNSNKVLSRASILEMLNPVGVGSFAVGFHIQKLGEGWYFGHTGANWGFRCSLTAHKAKGYGVAIMTNSSRGSYMSRVLRERIARAYGWDLFEEE